MKRHNLRPTSKLLVQSILNGQFLSANKLFKKLITEAEEDREKIAALIVEADGDQEDFDDPEFEEGGEEPMDEEGGEEPTDEEGGEDPEQADLDEDTSDELDDQQALSDETIEDIEADKQLIDNVDDISIIRKNVNQKMISNIFDKLANIKIGVQELELDPESREYITYDESLNYYSDKLLEIQNKVSEQGDQEAIAAALDKIKESLQQLANDAGIDTKVSADDIKTPDELAADDQQSIEDIQNSGQNSDEEASDGEDDQFEDEQFEDQDVESGEKTNEDFDEDFDDDFEEAPEEPEEEQQK